jgi:hypothetical protein
MSENTRKAHGGGVGAKVSQVSLRGPTRARVAAPSARGKYPNFVNNGGPVVTTPSVHVSFWGSSWQSRASDAARLTQFCTDLLDSDFMNVLSQYGVGTGKGSGNVSGTSTLSSVAAQLTNATVESTIQAAVDSGTIPEPQPRGTNVLIVFLDESIEISDKPLGIVMCEPSGDTAFGYHDFFTTNAGNKYYYAIVPALDDACVRRSCPSGDAGCSLHLTQTQEQRRTQVTSHEFAEMTTDPELNAWYDPQNGENGDICNGETETIMVGSNSWNVQRVYSKVDDVATNGATYCLAQAKTPKPPA